MPRWMWALLILLIVWFLYTNPAGLADIVLGVLGFLWRLAGGVGDFFGRVADGLNA